MLMSRFSAVVLMVASVAAGGVCSAAALSEDEMPTGGGILRLVRGWRWCNVADLPGPESWSTLAVEELEAKSHDSMDLDRLAWVDYRKQEACDRLVWKAFRVPDEWRGRSAWFTYDARRLEGCGVDEVWLNGEQLPVAILDKPL